MSGKARERESDEKVCKGKVCGGADREKSEGWTGNTQGRRKCGEQIYNGKQNAESVSQGRTGEERQRNRTGRKRGDKRAEEYNRTDRGQQRRGKGQNF